MSISTFSPDQIDAHQLLVQVADGRRTASFDCGQWIYRQGETAAVVFFLQQGEVQIALTENGNEQILGVANARQFFGASCLYNVKQRVASAIALTNCRITSVTKEAILAAIAGKPRFAKMFTDHLWYNDAGPQKELIDRLLDLEDRLR